MTRYFLSQDDSCHWYLIPADRREEWDTWRNLASDDERSWEVPDFARFIDNPSFVTFTNPESCG